MRSLGNIHEGFGGEVPGRGFHDLLALVCGVCCEFVTFPWYPGSGVVFDFIDS